MPPSWVALSPCPQHSGKCWRICLTGRYPSALFNYSNESHPTRLDRTPGVTLCFGGSCRCHAVPKPRLLACQHLGCCLPCPWGTQGRMNLMGLGIRPLPHPLHHPMGWQPAALCFGAALLQTWAELAGLPWAAADAWGDLVSCPQPSYTTCSLRGA